MTPLQDSVITAYLLLEDARAELTTEQWRAFVWILCDLVGAEAARAAVAEAHEALKDVA